MGVQYSHNEPSTAAEIVTAALQKDPDIVGIFAANLFAAEGSATGVQQAGKQGQVTIVGFDAGPAQVKALEAGTVQALVAQEPASIGSDGVKQAIAAAQGRGHRSQDPDRLHDPDEGQHLHRRQGRGLQVLLLMTPDAGTLALTPGSRHPPPPPLSREVPKIVAAHPPKRQNLATRAPRPPPHGAPHDRTHRRRPPLPRGERVRAAYDRAAVRARIVHFGVGGFHRAHEAMYLDRLLEAGHDEWALCGVGVLSFDAAMRDALSAQDDLYTLVTTAPDGTSTARVVGSIVEYLFVPDDPEAVIAKLAHPDTAIVSLTITEGGYGIDDATGAYAPRDEATLADLEGSDSPRSVMGLLTEGLRRRRDAGIPAFTVMSCDNIQGNGHVARAALLGFAERRDAELAAWIAENATFRTRWSTASRRSPRMRPEPRSPRSSASGTAGPCAASRSRSGCSKTISPAAARPSTRSACSWSATSSRTSS